MFTGIVQAVGQVRPPHKLGDGVRLRIATPPEFGLSEVAIGESIAVNGACMTVIAVEGLEFDIEVSAESLSKTTGLDRFGPVNLERAMRLGDRLDGHLVSGHVDGIGQVESLTQVSESWRLVLLAPRRLSPCLAYKGSVAVNGVSLTINSVEDTVAGARISINLIPHTMSATTLGLLKPQDAVNLEVDLIARYLERMVSLREASQDLL